MNHQDIINNIEHHIQKDMAWVCNAHDRYHIDRVRLLARKISRNYSEINTLIVELWALLHEYFDEKFFSSEQLITRKEKLFTYLHSLWINEDEIDQIMYISNNVWFGKSLERDPKRKLSLEFQIVEDADRLESIGAIAIARTFSYGGKKWRPIYDPTHKPQKITSQKSYRISEREWSSINHFYEKLLLLKDLLHTQPARNIAQKRHEFMELYLEQFLHERNCDS